MASPGEIQAALANLAASLAITPGTQDAAQAAVASAQSTLAKEYQQKKQEAEEEAQQGAIGGGIGGTLGTIAGSVFGPIGSAVGAAAGSALGSEVAGGDASVERSALAGGQAAVGQAFQPQPAQDPNAAVNPQQTPNANINLNTNQVANQELGRTAQQTPRLRGETTARGETATSGINAPTPELSLEQRRGGPVTAGAETGGQGGGLMESLQAAFTDPNNQEVLANQLINVLSQSVNEPGTVTPPLGLDPGIMSAIDQTFSERRQAAEESRRADEALALEQRGVNLQERGLEADISQGQQRLGLEGQRVQQGSERIGLERQQLGQQQSQFEQRQAQEQRQFQSEQQMESRRLDLRKEYFDILKKQQGSSGTSGKDLENLAEIRSDAVLNVASDVFNDLQGSPVSEMKQEAINRLTSIIPMSERSSLPLVLDSAFKMLQEAGGGGATQRPGGNVKTRFNPQTGQLEEVEDRQGPVRPGGSPGQAPR